MQVTVVGFSGMMGSGKDTAADIIEKETSGVHRMSYAQPLKQIAQIVYDMKHGRRGADHELYSLILDILGGPSSAPDFIDIAVVMDEIMQVANETSLVRVMDEGGKPRRFLQLVGTEIIRSVKDTAWADHLNMRLLRDASKQLDDYRYDCDHEASLPPGHKIVVPSLTYVITDMRFDTEIDALQSLPQMVDAKFQMNCRVLTVKLTCDVDVAVARVCRRDGVKPEDVLPTLSHASETGIGDEKFDAIIDNSGTFEEFADKIRPLAFGNIPSEPRKRLLSLNDSDAAPSQGSFGKLVDLSSLRQSATSGKRE